MTGSTGVAVTSPPSSQTKRKKRLIGVTTTAKHEQYDLSHGGSGGFPLVLRRVLEHGRKSPFAMQVLVGHIVNVFQFLRGSLSVLFEVYQFMQRDHVLTERRLCETLRWKLAQCKWLVFLAEPRHRGFGGACGGLL